MVEECLKNHITAALLLTAKCVGNRIPFKMTGDDYSSVSLPRLIGIFQKLTKNDDLVRRLNEFKNKRDFLAHKAIAQSTDFEGELVDSIISEIEPLLESVRIESEKLVYDIQAESSKITVILDFWDIPLAETTTPNARDIEGRYKVLYSSTCSDFEKLKKENIAIKRNSDSEFKITSKNGHTGTWAGKIKLHGGTFPFASGTYEYTEDANKNKKQLRGEHTYIIDPSDSYILIHGRDESLLGRPSGEAFSLVLQKEAPLANTD